METGPSRGFGGPLFHRAEGRRLSWNHINFSTVQGPATDNGDLQLTMNDDGWYSSFVGRSGKPLSGVQKLVERRNPRRDTILEGSPSVPKRATDTKASEKKDPWNDLSTPSVCRKVKSYSDFENAYQDCMKINPNDGKAKKEDKDDSRSYLEDEIKFQSWYHVQKDDLIAASHEPYHVYHDQLWHAESYLESLLQSANSTLATLSSLADSFRAVESQTTDFQTQCEGILEEQKRTSNLADEITENLQYYNYLEPITKRLNAPGAGSLVRRSEFPEMLENLDACLDYMNTNSKQREASSYATKYRLLLTRSLTLIRNHFSSTVRDIAADVAKRIADRQLNDTTMTALLYAKFRVGAPEMKKLGREIQKRARPPSGAAPGAEGEYQGLMNELLQTYASARSKLVLPIVTKKMNDIANAPSTGKDLVSFARSCINFIRGLAYDEYQLWSEWFDSEHMLYPFLESLCEPFYDHLRPRIVRETKIINLCELCTLIQSRYMEHSESEESEPEGPDLDFGRLIQPALYDAQDRLVFQTQVSLRNDIQYFKPKPEHLDYPRRASRIALSGSRNQATITSRKGSNGRSSPIPRNPIVVDEDGAGREFIFEPGTSEYYPTLRKAIWLLSRTYHLIQSTVFDSIAHEIVHQTTLSLNTAATQISTRVSPTDANLFLLSHLLAFKHHILAFDIEFAAPDVRVDFTAPLWDLRAGLFSPSKLVRALGGGLVPRVVTDMIDARTEVDERLRVVIGELVTAWSVRIATPLDPTNANGAVPTRGRKPSTNPTPSDDATRALAVREAIEREVPLIRRKMDEYIHDRRTRDMLLRAVLEDVLVKYAAWLESRGLAGPASKAGKGKGKGREDSVWEEEVFGVWAVEAFGLDDIEDDDENGMGDFE